MPKILLTLASAFLMVLASMPSSPNAKAADANLPAANRGRLTKTGSYCHHRWWCGPAGCDLRRVCTRPCPDRYSCYSLYGAYGPYGGVAYWAGYTHPGGGY